MVRKAELLTIASKPDQYPERGLPELPLLGRSNVGKSSLINRLTGVPGLARTSSTPGRTGAIHLYRVDDAWFLVDLPGYGYAKVSKTVRAQWQAMIEAYLNDNPWLRAGLMIVDHRHKPTADDQLMVNWLRHYDLPLILVATKVDKLKQRERAPQLRLIRETLHLAPSDALIPFSAETGEGTRQVWDALQARLADPAPPA